jgi:hypothetical protein
VTRIPPSSVAYWTGEIEQKLRPLNEGNLETYLAAAGASAEEVPAILADLRGLPKAMQEHRLVYDAGVSAGRAGEFSRDLIAALATLDSLLADPAAGPVLGAAERQSTRAREIVSEFRRVAPLMKVVVEAQTRRLPAVQKGGNQLPNRQFLAVRLIEAFRRHALAIKASRNSPMTRVFVELSIASGEASRDEAGRPDITLRKAMTIMGLSQQSPD